MMTALIKMGQIEKGLVTMEIQQRPTTRPLYSSRPFTKIDRGGGGWGGELIYDEGTDVSLKIVFHQY